jgi:hypothetical protein
MRGFALSKTRHVQKLQELFVAAPIVMNGYQQGFHHETDAGILMARSARAAGHDHPHLVLVKR